MKLNLLSLSLICITFSSCNEYFFDKPQPVDSKNTYKIPKKYRGTWHTESDKSNTITIGKDYYKQLATAQLTESKKKLDLDTNTYFIRNKIYHTEEGKLKGGYNYKIIDDSVKIESIETNLVELGQNAFLRKFDYGYIVNVLHKEMDNWWELRFIDTRNKEGILIREIDSEDLEKNDNHIRLHEDFNKYIIANWTKNDFQNFIDIGGFSDTLYFLKYEEKIKK